MNFSFNTYIDDTWKTFLNKNLKWSIALLIRTLTLCIIMFIFIKMFQFTGITNLVNGNTQGSINVTPGPTENVSLPSMTNYTEDIKEINKLQTLLKKKVDEISD